MRDNALTLKRIVQSRGEAAGVLRVPGDAVLIERGRPRWLLLSCPCGCGEELPINLDSRAGPAWRLYKNVRHGVSVYPSVWRDTGCGSHFIIWRDRILLFGQDDEELQSGRQEEASALVAAVRDRLSEERLIPYVEIADELSEVPWDVLTICRQLVRAGFAREGRGKQRGMFCRKLLP
jgi:hypothetical protein